MEQPTPLPPRPRLGRTFFLTFLAPLAVGLIAFLLNRQDATNFIGGVLIASIGCSVAAAIMLARVIAQGIGAQIVLSLIGCLLFQIFYLFTLVAGCSMISGPMNMH